MSISTVAPTVTVATVAVRGRRVPARAGNANMRAALDRDIHPASGDPLLPATITSAGDIREVVAGCGDCVLATVKILTHTDRATGESRPVEHLKCGAAPVSRRGRQGPDLRFDTPTCVRFRSRQDQDN